MKYIFLLIFSLNFHFDSFASAAAAASKPKVKTNQNSVTEEFNTHIPFRGELEKEVITKREEASASVGSGPIIEVFNPQSNPEGLEGANPHSLEDKGQNKRDSDEMKFMNDFEIDYTRPGAMRHKKDVDEIINATDEIFRELSKSMKELDLDCKEVLKKPEIDSPYYIEIEREEHEETTYTPHFCEFPFYTYNCHDGASVTCEKRNVKCTEWKLENIHVSGSELVDKAHGAFHFDHVADKVFEMKLYSSSSARRKPVPFWRHEASYNSVPAMKGYLMQRHKPSNSYNFIEISDDMNFGWEGGIFSVCGRSHCGRTLWGKDHAWNTYIITYRHRECENICDKWSKEQWDERCSQKH